MAIQGFIQTILALRDLQLREDAQALQQQQLGIQQRTAQGNYLGGFQQILSGLDQPTSMLPYVGQIAPNTGLSADALTTMINRTPAAVGTTRGRAVQTGAQAQPDLAGPAATKELTGTDEAGLAQSHLMARIFGEAGDYYSSLGPDDQQGFQAGVLSRLTKGQSVGEAAQSEAAADFLKRAPQALRDEVAKIGMGLAPNASSDAQTRLGWAEYRLNVRKFENDSALDELRVRSALAQAQTQMDAQAFKEVNELLNHRSELLQNMTRTAATQTPEGIRAFAQQLNAYNQQLRQAAPGIYGPKGFAPIQDIGVDKSTGATGFLPFVQSWLNQK